MSTETFIGNDVGLPLFLSIVLVRVSQKNSIFAIEYLCMLLPLDKRGRIFLICSRSEKLKATKDKGSEAHSFTFIKQTIKQK